MFGDLQLGKMFVAVAVVGGLAAIALWELAQWLMRHVRVEWVS